MRVDNGHTASNIRAISFLAATQVPLYALQSTKILTCLSFSSIKARYPSSTTRSILIVLVIICSGFRLPSFKAWMTPAKSCLRYPRTGQILVVSHCLCNDQGLLLITYLRDTSFPQKQSCLAGRGSVKLVNIESCSFTFDLFSRLTYLLLPDCQINHGSSSPHRQCRRF
jgi:hypothetical protein